MAAGAVPRRERLSSCGCNDDIEISTPVSMDPCGSLMVREPAHSVWLAS